MSFTVSHVLNTQASQLLDGISKEQSEWSFGTFSWAVSVVCNIPTTLIEAVVLFNDCIADLALSVYRVAIWIFQGDEIAKNHCYNQLWNTFLARPIQCLSLVIRPFCKPLYKKICLLVNADNYATCLTQRIDSSSLLAEATVLAEKIHRVFTEQPHTLWPHFEDMAQEDDILATFGKDHHLLFHNTAEGVTAINSFVHTLSDSKISDSKKSPSSSFFQNSCGITGEKAHHLYVTQCHKLVTKVKYCLAKEWLINQGISPETASKSAIVALAYASRSVWQRVKSDLKQHQVHISLLRNNLVVTREKKVFLELGFTNHVPRKGCWAVRDIIPSNTEAKEGYLSFELSDKAHSEATLHLVLGNEPPNGKEPRALQGGMFLADGEGTFIPPHDAVPTF